MTHRGRRIELRDIDGSYVCGLVLDEDRLKVSISNLAPDGDVMVKPPCLSWTTASQDVGGCTRLSPYALVAGGDDTAEGGLTEEIRAALDADEDVLRAAHAAVEARSRLCVANAV